MNREERAAARIARREEASKRRIEAHAARREAKIARFVARTVDKNYRSIRIPTHPIPAPSSPRDRFLTTLLGSANPKPVGPAPNALPSRTRATSSRSGLRRVKTRTGWITIKKKVGAVTQTMRKSKNRMKRALGELLR